MTVGGDFIPSEDRRGYDAPTYPTVFGLRLTPTVSGTLLALLGLGLAGYLLVRVVQPTYQRNQELRRQVAEQESQLINQEEVQRQIAEARANLEEAQQLRADVLTLFANPESVDTLLLDINERVQAVNAGIQDEERRATLSRFDLDEEASGVVTDSSLGTEVNNQLQRRVFNVEMEGNFVQTQSIIRNIERLQPLLVVRNLRSELDSSTQVIRLNEQGRLTPTGQPATRITTAFQLNVLLPVEETAPATPAEGQPAEGQPAEGEAAN